MFFTPRYMSSHHVPYQVNGMTPLLPLIHIPHRIGAVARDGPHFTCAERGFSNGRVTDARVTERPTSIKSGTRAVQIDETINTDYPTLPKKTPRKHDMMSLKFTAAWTGTTADSLQPQYLDTPCMERYGPYVYMDTRTIPMLAVSCQSHGLITSLWVETLIFALLHDAENVHKPTQHHQHHKPSS